ncbi:MAG: hypothetical protein U0359_09400 [Byssovorax sp.]
MHQADREGPGGASWPKLLKLVHKAGEALSARWFPAGEPLLLAQPGLLGRYGLTGLLDAIVRRGGDRDSAAVFLLVPCHDTGGIPRINETLSVPGVLPGQALWVSRAWLSNLHNAAG